MASKGDSIGTASGKADAASPEDLRTAVHRRDHKELPWRHVVGFLFKKLLIRHPYALAAAIFLTLLLTMAEVFGFSLVIPFLDALQGDDKPSIGEGTALGFLVPLFEGMSTVAKIRMVAVLMIANELVKTGLLYGLTRVAQYINIMIQRDLRLMIFDDLMAVELRWVNKQRSSNLFTLLHSFPKNASKIVEQLLMGLQNGTSFVALVIMLLLIDWRLTLISGVMAAVTVGIVVQLTKFVRRYAIDIKEARLRMHATTLESLQALKLIHTFGRVRETRDRFQGDLTHLQDRQWKQARVNSLISPLQSFLSTALVAGTLIAATYVMDRSADYWVGMLAAFMAVTLRFMTRSGKYAKRRAAIAAALPGMEAVIDHLERKDKTYLKSGPRNCHGLKQSLRFENVHFRYDDDSPDVINGVDLEVRQGQTTALVGGSGAGKSTLIDLATRLFDPTQGRLLVDGQDLRELRIEDWRHRIAVVSQDTFLFNDSVLENIRYGRPDATDAEIFEAAGQANAAPFIAEMEQGYHTLLGDRGVRLSGGQRQRIAIARAILANPDLLILDEATSALDTETEHLVQSAIDLVSKDRTIIAIAHRLSTIRAADQIVVLEHGQVVERGRHAELLAKRGRYHELVQLQDLQNHAMAPAVREAEAPATVAVAPRPARVHGSTMRFHVSPPLAQSFDLTAVTDLPGVVRADMDESQGSLLVALEDPSVGIPLVFAELRDQGHQVEDMAHEGHWGRTRNLEPAQNDDHDALASRAKRRPLAPNIVDESLERLRARVDALLGNKVARD